MPGCNWNQMLHFVQDMANSAGLMHCLYVAPRASHTLPMAGTSAGALTLELDALFPSLAASSVVFEILGGGITRVVTRCA